MNTNLNYEGFEKYLCKRTILQKLGGIQYLFKFDNHYGASVVKHKCSYGHEQDLWELAVILFDECGEWDITYDTDITNDVIGYLSDEKVKDILGKIKSLKSSR